MAKKKQDSKMEVITAFQTQDLLHPVNFLKQGFHADPDLCRQAIRTMRTQIKPVNFQRFRLEENAAYQQPIPYLLVYMGDGKFLSYARGKEGGDDRMHGKHSVGFGGHVNLDQDGADVLKGARRELTEELKFGGLRVTDKVFQERVSPLGILKNWLDDIGSVHVGLIMLFDASGLKVTSREKDLVLNEPADWCQLDEMGEHFAGWSDILIDYYYTHKDDTPWMSKDTSKPTKSSRKATSRKSKKKSS